MAGPFPYGADRSSITKAFRELQWDVKPLQPFASVPGKGNMWSLVSVQEPPAKHFQLAHGDVLVSKQRAEKQERTDVVRPLASEATMQLCSKSSAAQSNSSSSATDPWQNWSSGTDPWQNWSRPKVEPSAAVRDLEANVEKAVLAKLPAASMEVDVSDRVQALEQNVQRLMHQHSSLEVQVRESEQRQTQQIVGVQTQLAQQGQQFSGALESQNQNMAAMFQQQMAQIRQLLSKRSREEGDEDFMG